MNERCLIWLSFPLPGFPLVPVSIHAVARKKYFDDKWVMFHKTCANKQRGLHMCSVGRDGVRACRPVHICVFIMCVFVCILGSEQFWLRCFSRCSCWMSVETHLLYAVHGPIVAALLVSLLLSLKSSSLFTAFDAKWHLFEHKIVVVLG